MRCRFLSLSLWGEEGGLLLLGVVVLMKKMMWCAAIAAIYTRVVMAPISLPNIMVLDLTVLQLTALLSPSQRPISNKPQISITPPVNSLLLLKYLPSLPVLLDPSLPIFSPYLPGMLEQFLLVVFRQPWFEEEVAFIVWIPPPHQPVMLQRSRLKVSPVHAHDSWLVLQRWRSMMH